jgi:nucleoid-associated protein YgaU
LLEERLWAETDQAWAQGDFTTVTERLDALKALQPEDAAEIDEKIAAAQFNHASQIEQSGDLDRALYLYQEAQRRNPNLGEATFAIERIQAALAPPAEAPAEPAEQTYTVEPGDSLWAIAEKFYGSGNDWSRILEANRDQISDPDMIQPGQTLRIP